MGSLRCMAHNPHNGIVHLGHQNGKARPLHHPHTHRPHTGTVTLWSPNMHTSLVKLLCHQAPLTAVAIETGGWYMATAGMDAKLKIWDIRNYKSVNPTTTTVSCSTCTCTSVFRSSLTEQLQTLSHVVGILILYHVHFLYNCTPSHPCTHTHTYTGSCTPIRHIVLQCLCL